MTADVDADDQPPGSGFRDVFNPVNPDILLGRTHAPVPAADSRFDKWVRWSDRVRDDVQDVYTNRYVYREVSRIVAASPDLPGSLFSTTGVTTTAAAKQSRCDVRPPTATIRRPWPAS